MNSSRFHLGIDVGGTFTDLVCVDEQGELRFEKTVTDASDLSKSVLRGIEKLAATFELDAGEFLRRTDLIVHGTTISTNAMIENKGSKVGLITTAGFRDELEMRRGFKEDIYDVRLEPPTQIVPRRRRLGVRERIDHKGSVLVPLDQDDCRSAIGKLMAMDVESIAVALLFSFSNPAHEERIAELISEETDGRVVTYLSSEVLPQIREYERTSTTVVNAFVSPKLGQYLDNLSQLLKRVDFGGTMFIMQSNGGVLGLEEAARFGVGSLLSGPAGGVTAAAHLGSLIGFENLITMDMGGTSCDVCLIDQGTPTVTTESWLSRHRIAIPMLNIHTIGAGGGSIAWIADGGLLRVGPQSAGADPGPACYGRGGTTPTVTDASLILGYLDPETSLGGEIALDLDAARGAIKKHVANPLAMAVEEAAFAIHRIVNNNLMNAISLVSTEGGYDIRDFALLAMGGAGPIHAGQLAAELEISTVIVPHGASAICALGDLLADLQVTELRTYYIAMDDVDVSALNRIFSELYERAERRLANRSIRRTTELRRFIDMRYVGQVHEVSVPLRSRTRRITPFHLKAARHDFHRMHERLYAHKDVQNAVEMLNVRLDLVGRRHKPTLSESEFHDEDASYALSGKRPVYFPTRLSNDDTDLRRCRSQARKSAGGTLHC